MSTNNNDNQNNNIDIDDAIKALSEANTVDESLEKYVASEVGTTVAEKGKLLDKVFYMLCIVVTCYHLYTVIYFPPTTLMHRSLHVGMMLVLCFFMFPLSKKNRKKGKIPWYDYLFMLLAMSVPIYVITNFEGIISRSLIPNTPDIVFATILVFVVLEGMRRSAGLTLPIICGAFLLYGLFGRNMPGMFRHRGYSWDVLSNHLFSNTEGIFGTSVAVASSFIFMFVLFGAVMNKTGMGKLFTDLALAMSGHSKGGPAKVSVISSSLIGSLNGSAVANVVTTGPFTIPLMNKVGYSKTFAAAVESSSSIGSQILPPVMGAAAFIMAQMTGYSYGQIIVFATIPALLFYLGIFIQVHLRASKTGLVGIPRDKLPNVKLVLKERGHLLIPIIALIYFLIFTTFTVSRAAFYSIVLTIVVAQLKKSTRLSLRDILDAFAEGAKQSVTVAIACAAVGIIVGVISITGFGMAMVNAIIFLGGQNIVAMLLLVMITSLVLGLGVPSIPAYIITASIAAPALIQMGVPLIAAHMFVFYFSKFANITPPVGLVTMAAAGISGANFVSVGTSAIKLSFAGFIIPFIFIFSTDLMLIDVTFFAALQVIVTSVIGVFMLAVAIEGYMIRDVNILLRIAATTSAILMIIPETISDITGLAIFTGILILQLMKVKNEVSTPAV